MKRYDLRALKDDFYNRMLQLLKEDIKDSENAIFIFEIGDFSPIQKSADLLYKNGYTLMNSIKFNEVDWTIVVKKVQPEKKQEILEEKEENQ